MTRCSRCGATQLPTRSLYFDRRAKEVCAPCYKAIKDGEPWPEKKVLKPFVKREYKGTEAPVATTEYPVAWMNKTKKEA